MSDESPQPDVQGSSAAQSEPVSYGLRDALSEAMLSETAVAEPAADTLNDTETVDATAEPPLTDDASDTDDESDDDAVASADGLNAAETSTDDEPAKLSRRQAKEQERLKDEQQHIQDLETAKAEWREEEAKRVKAEADLARVQNERAAIDAEVTQILGDDEEFVRLRDTPRIDLSYEDQERLDTMLGARKKFGIFRSQARTEGFASLVQEVFAATDLPGVDPDYLRKPATSMTDIVKHFHSAGVASAQAKQAAQTTQYEEKIAQLEADIKALRPLRAAARPSAERGGHSASSAPPGADVYDLTRSPLTQMREAISGGH